MGFFFSSGSNFILLLSKISFWQRFQAPKMRKTSTKKTWCTQHASIGHKRLGDSAMPEGVVTACLGPGHPFKTGNSRTKGAYW